MFKRLEGDTAILRLSGVFKVTDLYELDGKLFAAIAGGYVRLYARGTTSKDKLHIERLAIDGPLYRDGIGRLCTEAREGRTLLTDRETEPLMIERY